ncbi:hypothetical protein ABT298_05105, partial [Streptomyces sp. NPDC001034]
ARAAPDRADGDDLVAALPDLTGGRARHVMDTTRRPGLLARAAGALRHRGHPALTGLIGLHRRGRFPVGRLVTTFSSRTSNEAVSGVRDAARASRCSPSAEQLPRARRCLPGRRRAAHHVGMRFSVTARDVTLLPATAQRPRPPVWIGGFWPRRAPMRRAARWDGAVPLFETARHGQVPEVAQVRELIDHVRAHRTTDRGRPFDFVLGGATPADPARARDVIGPLRDAGATWWDERQLQGGPGLDRLEPVLRRVEAGPPTL